MKVSNLSRAEAEASARSAALFTKRAHCAMQLRNGRWTWCRMSFLTHLFHIFGPQRYRTVMYFSGKGLVVERKSNA